MKNREIKFRAWDKERKKFFERGKSMFEMSISITLNGEIIGHPNIGEMTSLYELNQFSGLQDGNGIDIYEGDIVKGANGNICIVEFRTGTFGRVEKNGKWIPELKSIQLFSGEIIGNIYENANLLTPSIEG